MAHFHSLTVRQIEPLTPSSVAITFDVPKELKETFAFVPGQYITIKKDIEGKDLRRAYSISSSSKCDHITIGVKKLDKGGFSYYANTELKVGDTLQVMPPEGRFVFKPDGSPKNVAAFAAGSGITPIMSILKEVLESNPHNTFVLVYGNKSNAETMFYKDLVTLQSDYADRFFVYFTNSKVQEEGALFGRIDTSSVNYALKNKHKNMAFDAFYLCGPEDMIHLVSDTLQDNGIPKDKILFELFTTTANTEVAEGTAPVVADGKAQVTVILDDEEFELTMDNDDMILDAVLTEDIDAPYSCKGGVCSSCIARITEGKAEMVKNQILTDGEIGEGLVLTCQAHPLTPVLKVDYDDV